MARTYTLRRVIPQEECPQTCCQETGRFPSREGSRACQYHDSKVGGRKYGGCPFIRPDGTQDDGALVVLNSEQRDRFVRTCLNYLVPSPVPELNAPYPTDFGQGFGAVCPCFEWEMGSDGN